MLKLGRQEDRRTGGDSENLVWGNLEVTGKKLMSISSLRRGHELLGFQEKWTNSAKSGHCRESQVGESKHLGCFKEEIREAVDDAMSF